MAMVDDATKVGVVIEVNSETDFVAKNNEFVKFVEACAKTVAANKPASVEALMDMQAVGLGMTVAEALREKILTIGENMKIRRFTFAEGTVCTYVHGGGRIGVMVMFDTDLAGKAEFEAYAKDIAMQVAAVMPSYLDEASVPAEVIEKEKEILKAQIANDEKLKNKPAQIIEKMVDGRIGKFYKENCLMDQAFIKDGEISVAKYTENTAKELGGSIKVTGFVRYEKGEGLEKKEDNFAEEVASMMK